MDSAPRPPGGRRVPRPQTVEPCPTCRADLATSYLSCPTCDEAVDRYWHADWDALLAAEGISPGSEDEQLLAQAVVAEQDRHPWTVVDLAMSKVACSACGGPLGGGVKGCAECDFAFGNLWAYDQEASRQGTMTMNEHALRVARWVIRHPHRFSVNVVTGWRSSLPRMLTGWLPTTREAQSAMAAIRKSQRE
jgi:hypothetical protein